MTVGATENRRVVLRRRPAGILAAGDTELVTDAVPEIADGQALVRTVLLAMDPVTRIILAHDIGLVPPVKLGEPLRGFGSGIVVASRNGDFPQGAKVAGFFEWSDFQVVVKGARMQVLPEDIPLDAALNVYGHTAMAAYFGLLDIGKPEAGQTVLVSGAAGAVGSVAGQIAAIKGCRAIGIAGGPDKCRWLVEELGFHGAIDHRDERVGERLKALCPTGVDLFFDNVGGTLLNTVLPHLAARGRVVICGASSQYTGTAPPDILRTGRERVAGKVPMTSFNAMDYAARFPVAAREMRSWEAEGRLKLHQMMLLGLEQAPKGLNMLFTGESRGRVLVSVDKQP
jgi:NADPH-dependent curcumin reductase CurA